MNKDEVYSGFKVIDCTDAVEQGAVGLWLRHEATGMEVYHLRNDDSENLFAFAFKTPPSDSTGVAHILEHSVLCGSRHFPLKDPFLQLANQSVKTFLNAMTFPDKTVYPASSLVEADYFNLMAVYGDAVFFPLLEKWIFSQEAHRLEPDAGGKLTIQGVVYNEMKGNYSSPESIAGEWALRSILPGTVYDHDSGGNPAHIPDLTYEQFRQFHADYYHPSNCRLFLCGNIDTKKQLDFICERFLKHFTAPLRRPPAVIEPVRPFEKPVELTVSAPAAEGGKKESSVQINWLWGDSTDPVTVMEAVFLSEILLGHDGSPLCRALVESGLGEDIAPATGLEGELLQLCFTVSLRGVRQKNVRAFETLVFDTLRELTEKGIPAQEVEAACMSIDFNNREVRRASGPFSLTLMRRVLRSWLHGGRPDAMLFSRKTFEVIRERAAQSDYVPQLIKRLLLDNIHRSLVIVKPDPDYDKGLAAAEQAHIDRFTSAPCFSMETLRAENEALRERQQKPDSPQVCSLIPHLNPADFSDDVDVIRTERTRVSEVPVFLHTEPTNGIVYIEFGIPLDSMQAEDLPYLPFFSSVYTSTGFGGMDWIQASAHAARIAGSFTSSVVTSSDVGGIHPSSEDKVSLQGRTWLFFHIKMLEEKLSDCVDMLFSCMRTADFTDSKRIKDLLLEERNQLDSSLVPCGHQYALLRASYRFGRAKAIEEIWNGVSQIFTIRQIADSPLDGLCARFERIRAALFGLGAIVNITAEKNGIDKALRVLDPYLKEIPPIQEKPPVRPDDLNAFCANLPGLDSAAADSSLPEYLITPSQVGFAALAITGSSYGTREAAFESVLGHWLSNSVLWERVRTIGGAYGAFAFTDSISGCFKLATYRDPAPEKSLEVLKECLAELCKTEFDSGSVQKAIMGCYSKEIQPYSPSARGSTGFVRFLHGITSDMVRAKVRHILQVTPDELHKAACTLSGRLDTAREAVLASKGPDNSGAVIIPLE